jgi:hypothetical protein
MNDASHPSKPAFPQPVSGTVVPRFGDVATFMRLPLFRDPADVEIGMVEADKIEELKASGADAFLQKPFEIETLIDRMCALLDVQR